MLLFQSSPGWFAIMPTVCLCILMVSGKPLSSHTLERSTATTCRRITGHIDISKCAGNCTRGPLAFEFDRVGRKTGKNIMDWPYRDDYKCQSLHRSTRRAVRRRHNSEDTTINHHSSRLCGLLVKSYKQIPRAKTLLQSRLLGD